MKRRIAGQPQAATKIVAVSNVIFAAMVALASLGCDEKRIVIPEAIGTSSGNSVEVSNTYKLTVDEAPLTANSTAKTTITVKAKSGYDVNAEFPWKFTFADGSVVSKKVDKTAIEFSQGTATVPVELKTADAGELEFTAFGSFSICKKGDRGVCYSIRNEPFPLKVSVE